MFSTFLNSSSDATYVVGHDHRPQQPPFSSTFQDDGQLIPDQFYQLQPTISHYSDQQTLIDRHQLATVGYRPVKKDRHSKIRTAQGLRDRRVRLSIGAARRFFDLQEMLGFDQPSKTLEWLLGNSTNAINKLAAGNVNCSTSSSSHSTASASNSLKSSSSSNCIAAAEDIGPKTTTKVGNELNAVAAREFGRTKARARARERTLEKLTCSRVVNWSQAVKVNDDDGCSSCPDLLFASNLKMCNNLSNEEVSVVDNTSSTTTPTPMIRHQQNLVIAKEGETSYLNNLDYYFPNLPSSWDMYNW